MANITGRPEIDGALTRDLTIDITTIGRRSGEPRTVEIWFLAVDDRIFITGTPGPRDWYANLLADNTLIFHFKESVRVATTALTNRQKAAIRTSKTTRYTDRLFKEA